MGKYKLTIENFAGIKYAEIKVNELTILIGPQASGKSVIAKLLYYFNDFFNPDYIVNASFQNGKNFEVYFKNLQRNKFEKFFPPTSWKNENFHILFKSKIQDYEIELIHTNELRLNLRGKFARNQIKFLKDYYEFLQNDYPKLAHLEKKIEEIKSFLNRISESRREQKKKEIERIHSLNNEYISLKNEYIQIILKSLSIQHILVKPQNIFIPANRSFFTLFKESFFKLLDADVTVDPFFVEFGKFLEGAKTLLFKMEKSEGLKKLSQKFLKAYYVRDNLGIEFLIHDNLRKVPLYVSSSGQQELFPILLVLYYFLKFVQKPEKGKVLKHFIFLEEPESHLFPTTQKQLVDLLAEVFNSGKTNMFITTHSPYILTSFNNLIFAGFLAKKFEGDNQLKKLSKIIPRKRWIFPDLVSVYMIHPDKGAYSIQDKKTGLISGTELDKVSDKISIEFSKLLSLELNDKE